MLFLILLNFFISIVMINYKRTAEEFSGEKKLSGAEKQWLSMKEYILSLEPEKLKRLPANCFRRTLSIMYTHKFYKIFQAFLLILFLVVSSLYRFNSPPDRKALYWQGVGLYIGLALVDYLAKLNACA